MTSFPSTGTFTGSVVFGATVKDTLGNTLGTASSQAITFTKDTVAPTVTGITYTTSGSVKGIRLTFSEDVVNSGVGSVVLINNKTGQSTSIANTTSGSGKTFILTGVNVEAGEYTVRLPEGLFKDKSFSANKLAATVLTVTIGSAATDSESPVLFNNGIQFNDSQKVSATSNVYGDATITVDIKDASGLNVASVMDVNSYTLDDKALPSGSYVTIQTLTEGGVVTSSSSSPKFARATIHIPSSSITETKTDYKFIVNGVTDTSGNPIVAASKPGKLTSRTSPLLTSAVVSSGNSYELILGFSKEVTVLNKQDLQFYINNDVAAANVINQDYYTVTKIVNGSDKGKWSVTFSKKIVDSSAAVDTQLDLNSNEVNRIIVKVAGTTTARDGDGNILTDSTEISAK